jgi:hypothetical protein
MPKLAAFLPSLADPDMPDLQQIANRQSVFVHVNPAARALGKPAIELFAKRPRQPMLRAFSSAAEALEWLQAGRPAEASQ